ncbi:MAG: RNA-guided endonuclease InsQ/TnpB family protein [Microcystaceae cyanobacterium]
MDSENTKKRSKKTLKYRVYPTGETKKVWMLRIHGVRKVYNNAIAYLNKHQGFTYINTKGEVKTTGKREFRSFCKTLGSEIIPQWCKDLQIAHALDNALFEAYTAWKKTDRQPKFIGVGINRKPNPDASKKMAKFRSIRSKNQTIQFDPHDYKNGHWMASSGLEKAQFWGQDYCLINYCCASELTYNKGRWYANFPVEMDAQPPRNGGKAIALDPGVRCFLTGFDGNNFTEFANGDFALIAKLCYHLDKLKSKLDLAKGGKFKRYRYQLRRAMERIRTRIHNLRSECHKQVASNLARNYDVIYLPTFETSQMVTHCPRKNQPALLKRVPDFADESTEPRKLPRGAANAKADFFTCKTPVSKSKRKLHSKTARAMMTWAFYEFSQTLQHLCNRYGSRLVRVTEEYTSKTCTSCGHIHTKLGSNKTFKCPHCGTIIKRDFNGALGIFLKALWDTTRISTVSAEEVVLSLACPECLG